MIRSIQTSLMLCCRKVMSVHNYVVSVLIHLVLFILLSIFFVSKEMGGGKGPLLANLAQPQASGKGLLESDEAGMPPGFEHISLNANVPDPAFGSSKILARSTSLLNEPTFVSIELSTLPSVRNNLSSLPMMGLTAEKALGVAGVGNSGNANESGIGGGKGMGLLGVGKSKVSFFGISAETARVALLVDISGSMVDPKRGGMEGYSRVKAELGRLVNGLSPETSFNVILFGSVVYCFEKDSLLLATDENKKAAVAFIRPIFNYETEPDGRAEVQGNFTAKLFRPRTSKVPKGGGTRIDLALLAAFEQGVDTVFIITDGVPNVFREEDTGPMDTGSVMSLISRWKHDWYHDLKRQDPMVHVVSYEADGSGNNFLKSLAGRSNGKFIKIKDYAAFQR